MASRIGVVMEVIRIEGEAPLTRMTDIMTMDRTEAGLGTTIREGIRPVAAALSITTTSERLRATVT